ncbi:60S ribosomal protein L9 [Sphaeroforma arctica JP610]|uniref:60S ribosomal protein L9 n=1 Tax=Sphaeroforma arctica JP610 TaxID=667725 RepID=A0A0L0FR56_9EUKA|nr:60S ribosomal protein L9 [Sphaeroforma arctica JP610]KNC79250.1 60S ribosomal protein L9 [Sphaeroforma arctica JP610]|eukprot:XP_014153152.1 60S ribosomal protein L9 [Sphaeroforma arctica JP610]
MKTILGTQVITIPEGVTCNVKSRVATVNGPRGKLVKNFNHLNLDIRKIASDQIRVDVWFAGRKDLACVRTVCSHIENMITGVTKGFKYHMRYVYAHFPINVNIENSRDVEIRNFLGEKVVRKITCGEGVTANFEGKDEISVQGNDIEMVSQAAAQIQQSTTVKRKDIRKFLDGIYVSKKVHIEGDE